MFDGDDLFDAARDFRTLQRGFSLFDGDDLFDAARDFRQLKQRHRRHIFVTEFVKNTLFRLYTIIKVTFATLSFRVIVK